MTLDEVAFLEEHPRAQRGRVLHLAFLQHNGLKCHCKVVSKRSVVEDVLECALWREVEHGQHTSGYMYNTRLHALYTT